MARRTSSPQAAQGTPGATGPPSARRSAWRKRIALVGVAPTGPEIEYGWIVRGARIPRSTAHEVSHFREKPTPTEADALWQAAGLWNTFIQTGPAHTFWGLATRHMARHAAALARYATADGSEERMLLEEVYRAMPSANFSCEVLARAGSLAVLPVAGSGWSDWGSPARVFASLAGTEGHDRLVDRIRGDLALAG